MDNCWQVAYAGNFRPGERRIGFLIEMLSTKDKKLRAEAIGELGENGAKAEAAVIALVNLIADSNEDKNLRMEAGAALQRIGKVETLRQCVPILLKVLVNHEAESDVRWRIMWALRAFGSELSTTPGVLASLSKVLSEQKQKETKMLQYDCAYMLGILQGQDAPEKALDVLLDFLKDDSILLYQGRDAKTGKEQGTGDGRIMALQALQEIGVERLHRRPDIANQLRSMAGNDSTLPEIRQKARELLRGVEK